MTPSPPYKMPLQWVVLKAALSLGLLPLIYIKESAGTLQLKLKTHSLVN